MKAVVQRVTWANVVVNDVVAGKIEGGMVVLASIEKGDTVADLEWMAGKLLGLRIFRNEGKHFDLDVKQIGGGLLLISNFTVAAETKKGRRPSLEGAETPEIGREMFERFVQIVKERAGAQTPVATGVFGADMKVSLLNDGPVTFIVDSR